MENKRKTPISRNIWDKHEGDVNVLSFSVIEVVPPYPRHGEWDRFIFTERDLVDSPNEVGGSIGIK